MNIRGFLGIDAGTQGLSVVVTDDQLKVLATGEGNYQMLADQDAGCYEQNPDDWVRALRQAMQQLHETMNAQGKADFEVLAIGISGQMHGEVLIDENNQIVAPARLWCDSRNEAEGLELTELLGVKVPKRMTAARWLWTTRNRPEVARRVRKLTTPAGWLSNCLTGEFVLGIGDASGMFPIDQQSLDYDTHLAQQFDQLVGDNFPSLKVLLPEVRKAGDDAGTLNSNGAEILGLPQGIPIAAAEGDQPAALAGSRIAEAGMVSVSFGTSVCANAVGDRPFAGVDDAIDHFCAVDGKPINMVFLRNGTTFMNTIVEMFAAISDSDFDMLMKRVLDASTDCDGVLALPFMDDEPGMRITEGGHASLNGLNSNNASAGNVIRAAMLATMMNLRLGMNILDNQGYPRDRIVLTGGLTRTPELGQILADVCATEVTLPGGADEGTAVGAALLAMFRFDASQGSKLSWSDFVLQRGGRSAHQFAPDSANHAVYDSMLVRYLSLVDSMAR